jgi:DNA-binding protein H-NS
MTVEKRALQQRLAKLDRVKIVGVVGNLPLSLMDRAPWRKYPKVRPKYHNPRARSPKWSARGKRPGWVITALGTGQRLDDLKIKPANRGRSKATTSWRLRSTRVYQLLRLGDVRSIFIGLMPTGPQRYFRRFERFSVSRCGTARYVPLRLRLVTTERRPITLRLFIRFSRPQLIVRISSNKTSQSSICDTNTACVEPCAVNKWNRDFAARIVFNEFNRATFNTPQPR